MIIKLLSKIKNRIMSCIEDIRLTRKLKKRKAKDPFLYK